ncbi:hypothetical protein ABH930_004265 [Kitasatospora sp. GAS204A]|uniref:hypothetical protein n=1 Tax=unclassified Kitasatospora TaxID=2633591 RepID=UPI0024752975|nr:hypothetical protein [Kitasatospora sp. GAS204B]MDH6119508.1 hypothetical protein [Kitasatospora sp. GAS204B]
MDEVDDAALATVFSTAGLDYLGMVDPGVPLIPPALATLVSSCSEEDGILARSVESGDPQLIEKVNSEWYRISSGGGLFGVENPEFLVAVNRFGDTLPRVWWWAKVKLADRWDIAGDGAASGILGNGPGHPAFVMLSLDGNVVVRGDRGEEWVDCVLLRNPQRVGMLRQHGQWLVERPRTDEFTRAALERWLSSTEER